MAKEKDLCMAQGLPLQERCAQAVESIRMLREQIRKMTEEEQVYRKQGAEKDAEMLKQISNEEARLALAVLLKESAEKMNKLADTLNQINWDGGVDLVRAMFGAEAVAFALEKTKNECPG